MSAVVADTARQVSQQLRAHVDLQLEQQLPRITAHLADTITAQVRVTACDAIPRILLQRSSHRVGQEPYVIESITLKSFDHTHHSRHLLSYAKLKLVLVHFFVCYVIVFATVCM